jgi:hypothetical protein
MDSWNEEAPPGSDAERGRSFLARGSISRPVGPFGWRYLHRG